LIVALHQLLARLNVLRRGATQRACDATPPHAPRANSRPDSAGTDRYPQRDAAHIAMTTALLLFAFAKYLFEFATRRVASATRQIYTLMPLVPAPSHCRRSV